MDVSIVIPVKNGGERLNDVLLAIGNQKTSYTYETIVVDSGSTDGSVALVKQFGAALFEIAPSEFGHGKTRTFGAFKGTGRYIVFLTQDALPASDLWLDTLVKAMDESGAAGGFGKHIPYADCNLVDQKMIYYHFIRFGSDDELFHTFELTDENRARYESDDDYEQYLSFFSDNCSIIRREIFEKIPYEDVDFAEDQVWARAILAAGYKKIYIPDGAVYHSHNYPMREYGKRYFDDFKAMYSVHGYNMCPDTKTFLKLWIKNGGSDCKYVLKRKDLSFFSKIYWCFYAMIRHYKRNAASVNAVRYFTYDDAKRAKIDAKYSQQISQRR